MRRTFDVDIDLPSDYKPSLTQAMVYNEKTQSITPHPSGYYFEDVPVDPVTGVCAFDYKWGEERGFMKVDLLTNRVYDSFKTKQDVLDAIVEENIDWTMFDRREVVERLPHLGKHFDIVSRVRPRSVQDLADILALIRPAKIGMLDSYLQNKTRVRRNLYLRPTDETAYFKKSHAISYALMIVAYLTVIDGGIKWG